MSLEKVLLDTVTASLNVLAGRVLGWYQEDMPRSFHNKYKFLSSVYEGVVPAVSSLFLTMANARVTDQILYEPVSGDFIEYLQQEPFTIASIVGGYVIGRQTTEIMKHLRGASHSIRRKTREYKERQTNKSEQKNAGFLREMRESHLHRHQVAQNRQEPLYCSTEQTPTEVAFIQNKKRFGIPVVSKIMSLEDGTFRGPNEDEQWPHHAFNQGLLLAYMPRKSRQDMSRLQAADLVETRGIDPSESFTEAKPNYWRQQDDKERHTYLLSQVEAESLLMITNSSSVDTVMFVNDKAWRGKTVHRIVHLDGSTIEHEGTLLEYPEYAYRNHPNLAIVYKRRAIEIQDALEQTEFLLKNGRARPTEAFHTSPYTTLRRKATGKIGNREVTIKKIEYE